MTDINFTFTKPKWEVIKDTKVFETPIFTLHKRKVLPDRNDTPGDFYVLEAPEWINVIALTPELNIVLVEQYRHGIDETTLEIPGGMVDPGEKPLEAAKRELAEETGYSASRWSLLGKSSSNPAILSNFTHLYLAEDCEKTQAQKTEGSEDIAVHTMALNTFLEFVRNGNVHHSIVLSAVTQLLLQKPGIVSCQL